MGTGFGLRYDISYLVIRADLGIGIHTPYPNPDKTGYSTSPVSRTGSGSTWRSAIRSKVRAGHPYEYEQAGWYYQPACSISVFPSKANGFPAAWTPNQKNELFEFHLAELVQAQYEGS